MNSRMPLALKRTPPLQVNPVYENEIARGVSGLTGAPPGCPACGSVAWAPAATPRLMLLSWCTISSSMGCDTLEKRERIEIYKNAYGNVAEGLFVPSTCVHCPWWMVRNPSLW